MPAVVSEYLKSGDIKKCQRIQRSIIDTYTDDFSKYSTNSKIKYLKKVFYAASSMIGQKFVYSKVDNNIKSRELKDAVEMLETAGVLIRIRRTNGDGLPLEANVKDNFFKILFLDVGLLHNITGIYGETIKEENLASIFKGAVAEQFVGMELLALQDPIKRPSLFYWAREAKNSNAEIDYLIAFREKIIPIEVKFGSSTKLRSMRLFMEQYNCKSGIKVSQERFSKSDNITSIPFYGFFGFLKSEGHY
jgi:predicted AAA+ superfamily ATPase